jgi:hypothetical protein
MPWWEHPVIIRRRSKPAPADVWICSDAECPINRNYECPLNGGPEVEYRTAEWSHGRCLSKPSVVLRSVVPFGGNTKTMTEG